MPISPSFSYTLNGHTVTNLTYDADFGAALAQTANDIATIINAVASDLANFNWGGLAGGTANALTLTPSPALASLVDGTRYVFIPAADNTNAATMNVSGTATDAILRPNGDPLQAGDIKSGEEAFIIFDGSDWKLTNWFPKAAAAFDPSTVARFDENTVVGVTLAASIIAGKVIYRSGPTSDFADTCDTAANIVAAASEPFVNGYFPLMLINASGKKWTISGGTGVTYATPDATSIVVASGTAKIVWVGFTNVSGGTEAVQLFGGTESTAGDVAILGNLNIQGDVVTAGDFVIDGTLSSASDAGFGGNMAVAGATALAGNFSVTGTVTFSDDYVALTNLPTSASGLGSGQLWNDSGTVKIV